MKKLWKWIKYRKFKSMFYLKLEFSQIYNSTFGSMTLSYLSNLSSVSQREKKENSTQRMSNVNGDSVCNKQRKRANTTCLHTACVLASKCHKGPAVQMVSLTLSSEPKQSVIVAFWSQQLCLRVFWEYGGFRWQRAILVRATCIWLLARGPQWISGFFFFF